MSVDASLNVALHMFCTQCGKELRENVRTLRTRSYLICYKVSQRT